MIIHAIDGTPEFELDYEDIVGLQPHPAAEIVPEMTDLEMRDLEESVRELGLLEPIVLLDGQILDGRHRLQACLNVGAVPRFIEWDPPPDTPPILWVLAKNAHRRHLTPAQRAAIAFEVKQQLLEMEPCVPWVVPGCTREGAESTRTRAGGSQNRERSQSRERSHHAEATLRAAEAAQVSPRAVEQFEHVHTWGAPELADAVRGGRVSLRSAEALADLPESQQRELLASGDPEEIRRAAEEQRRARRIDADTTAPTEEGVREQLRQPEPKKPHVANNSGNDEWYTPAPIIEAARATMGSIDLDPASCEVAQRNVRARSYYTAESDGLSQPWFGNVWLNPPYSSPLISRFADAVTLCFEAGEIDQACVLVNNATETGWFQLMAGAASGMCLIRGRVKFLDETGHPRKSPLQGQVVLYLGDRVAEFAAAFGDLGTIVMPLRGAA